MTVIFSLAILASAAASQTYQDYGHPDIIIEADGSMLIDGTSAGLVALKAKLAAERKARIRQPIKLLMSSEAPQQASEGVFKLLLKYRREISFYGNAAD